MKSGKKRFWTGWICFFICVLLAIPATAAQPVTVRVGNQTLQNPQPMLLEETTYVPLRETLRLCGITEIQWEGASKTAIVQAKNDTLRVQANTYGIGTDTGWISSTKPCRILNQQMYVPIRILAKALHAEVLWNASERCAILELPESSTQINEIPEEDVYWLSRIIAAESRGESYRGKLAVGSVILNRVQSPDYPNTVKGVIFDDRYGIQFTPVANQTIYQEPDAQSVQAAQECLAGGSLDDRILYFCNPARSTSDWMQKHCTYVFSIGHHDFYA